VSEMEHSLIDAKVLVFKRPRSSGFRAINVGGARTRRINLPVNWIAADILRIENGIPVEHWDVIQDEATEAQSKSKAPMFGSSFPVYSEAERTIG
jgi:hypothetical protein